ncbi:hypothetical protein CEXT_758611 [Caerostris extrusa]|uniref:Uncharacterized protein n=1 Tax=Caerostris extrusa TaxID=172846 RepID=A0AAV4Q4K6_CAEEX|nr:hypothetical protein CEXT_758611 [Caerostris extrusa]
MIFPNPTTPKSSSILSRHVVGSCILGHFFRNSENGFRMKQNYDTLMPNEEVLPHFYALMGSRAIGDMVRREMSKQNSNKIINSKIVIYFKSFITEKVVFMLPFRMLAIEFIFL